jgi:ABC-type multidrug transport system permease subunit
MALIEIDGLHWLPFLIAMVILHAELLNNQMVVSFSGMIVRHFVRVAKRMFGSVFHWTADSKNQTRWAPGKIR